MAVLETLPRELLIEILSNLSCTDLLQTSLVSHLFHQISQLGLYKAPCITSTSTVTTSTLQMVPRTTPTSLQLLLRTLLSPGGRALAVQVRTIRLGWDNIPSQPPPELRNDMAVLLTVAVSLFGQDISIRSQGAQVVLLLHLLPRLHTLDLSLPSDSLEFTDLLTSQCRIAPGGPSVPLRQLCVFRCASGLTDGSIRTTFFQTLLALPSVRIIDVRFIHYCVEPPPMPPRSSGVRKLRLARSYLMGSALACFLLVPAALTHFTYLIKSNSNMIYFARIGRALTPVQETLQYLHLNFNTPTNNSVDGTLGSFKDWARLRTLRCPLFWLLGSSVASDRPALQDLLPAGLRELEILEGGDWSVAQEIVEVLPILQQESVLDRLVMALGTSNGLPLVEELRRVCEMTGVVLVDSSCASVGEV